MANKGFAMIPPPTAIGSVDPKTGQIVCTPAMYHFLLEIQKKIGSGASDPFDDASLLGFEANLPDTEALDAARLGSFAPPQHQREDVLALAPPMAPQPSDELLLLPSLLGGMVREHDQLAGLSDDDHAQYALLAGRGGTETFAVDVAVPDEVYGAGWNGSVEVPTKNAVFDKVEAVVAGAVTDHGGLTGLADDDHTQYFLLAGRVTPQQAAFGTAASAATGFLTSTAAATKGKYFLNAAGTITVDEVNLRIGIGTATPGQRLHIRTSSQTQALLESTDVASFLMLADSGSGATTNVGVGSNGNNMVLRVNGGSEVLLTNVAFSPFASDGNALGTTGLMWSDLFLAGGAVVNFNNGDATITHTAGRLAVNVPIALMGYTVAGLPAGVVGMRAYVTDALAPTYGAAVVGGGAVTVPVFYNNVAWITA